VVSSTWCGEAHQVVGADRLALRAVHGIAEGDVEAVHLRAQAGTDGGQVGDHLRHPAARIHQDGVGGVERGRRGARWNQPAACALVLRTLRKSATRMPI
jgi:hypothetical protein